MSSGFTISKDEFCLQNENESNSSLSQYFNKKEIKLSGKIPPKELLTLLKGLVEQFHIAGPIDFVFTKEIGPRKVWRGLNETQKTVYFSQNAIELLLQVEIKKIIHEVCNPQWEGSKSFTIKYTHTVMEQFLRSLSTKQSLEQFLKEKTIWKFRSAKDDPDFNMEQEFRSEELITLVKQIVDVPHEVFTQMNIKSFSRNRLGIPFPIPGAKAAYIVEKQKILIGDEALIDDKVDLYGEGTVLHEMGHAYWFGSLNGLRTQFSIISWIKVNQDWHRKSEGSSGFISEYSLKSPEEDFAEHFSAYIHQSERLREISPEKFEFFRKQIFKDTEYFSTVSKNAKIHIDSPNPDKRPPWLIGSISSSFNIKAQIINEKKETKVRIEVQGAQDDLSGIGPSSIALNHEENSKIKLFVKLYPKKNIDGSYNLFGETVSQPSKLADGNYLGSNLALTDLAGNLTFYDIKPLSKIFLQGDISLKKDEKPVLDPHKIKIEKAPTINQYPGLILTLPIPFRKDIENIHLTWSFPGLEKKTTHVCNSSRSATPGVLPCILDPIEGQPIKLQAYFFKEYPATKIELASLLVTLKGSAVATKMDFSYVIPPNTSSATYFLETPNKHLNLLNLDVNKMQLKALTQLNEKGGDQSIVVSLPLLNEDAGKFYFVMTFRSPTGKRILHVLDAKRKKYEKSIIDGIEHIVFQVPLLKNPESGEYLVEGFKLETNYERPRNPYLPLDQNGLSLVKIKLIERGIKKTFTVTSEKKILLH